MPESKRSASDLPQEIINEIVRVAAAGRLDQWANQAIDASGRGSPNALLLAVSTVSKAWGAAAQYQLFSELYVGSTVISPPAADTDEDGGGSISDAAERRRGVQTTLFPQLLKTLEEMTVRNAELPSAVHRARLELGNGSVFRSVRGRHPVILYNGPNRRWGTGITARDRSHLGVVDLRGATAANALRLCQLCPQLA